MGCSPILTVCIQGLQVDLTLIRLVDIGYSGMFSDPHCMYTRLTSGFDFNQIGGHWLVGCSLIITVGIQGLQVDLVLIRLVDIGYSGMFSDPHCMYTRLISGFDFNQIGGHWLVGCSPILTVCIQGLQVDLTLIRLVDIGYSGMFSDHHSRYTRLTSGSGFNQIGGHWLQWDVLRSSLYVYKAYKWI